MAKAWSSATPRPEPSSGRAGPAIPDGTEVDPAHWWDAFQAIAAAGVLDDVECIAVGGQQHGMVTLDEIGTVVRPALLWNDNRVGGGGHRSDRRTRRC